MKPSLLILIASWILLPSCRHLSNRIYDVKLECGSDASSSIDYVKVVSPAGDSLDKSNLKIFDLQQNIELGGVTSKGCVPLSQSSPLAVSIQSELGLWGSIIDPSYPEPNLKLQKLDNWKISAQCSSITRTDGRIQNPLSWDKSINTRLTATISDAQTGNILFKDFEGETFNVDRFYGDGPIALNFQWSNPFFQNQKESASCSYLLDRKSPVISSNLAINTDKFLLTGGDFFHLGIADESPYTLQYCIYPKTGSCSWIESNESVNLIAPASGEWCIEYKAKDAVGNLSHPFKACGASMEQAKIEGIRTNLAKAGQSIENTPIKPIIFGLRALRDFKLLKTEHEQSLLRNELAQTLFNHLAQSLVRAQIKSTGMNEVMEMAGDFVLRSIDRDYELYNKDFTLLDKLKIDQPKFCPMQEIKFFATHVAIGNRCSVQIFPIGSNKFATGQTVALPDPTNTDPEKDYPPHTGLGTSPDGRFLLIYRIDTAQLFEWTNTRYALIAEGKSSTDGFLESPAAIHITEDGAAAVLTTQGKGMILVTRDKERLLFENLPSSNHQDARILDDSGKKILVFTTETSMNQLTYFSRDLIVGSVAKEMIFDGSILQGDGLRTGSLLLASRDSCFIYAGNTFRHVRIKNGEFVKTDDSRQEDSPMEWQSAYGKNELAVRNENGILLLRISPTNEREIERFGFIPIPISKLLSDNVLRNFSFSDAGISFGFDGVFTLWNENPLAGKLSSYLSRQSTDDPQVEHELSQCSHAELQKGKQINSRGIKKIAFSDDGIQLKIAREVGDCKLEITATSKSTFTFDNIQLSPDEKLILIESEKGQAALWQLDSEGLTQLNSSVIPLNAYDLRNTWAPDSKFFSYWVKKRAILFDLEWKPRYNLQLNLPGYNLSTFRVNTISNTAHLQMDSLLTAYDGHRLTRDYYDINLDPNSIGFEICNKIGDFLKNGLKPEDWSDLEPNDRHLCDAN